MVSIEADRLLVATGRVPNGGQLNVEAFCLALSKVYTFGPTFRAENSNTSRHLAEFWMVEPEIAFADLAADAALAEALLFAPLVRAAGAGGGEKDGAALVAPTADGGGALREELGADFRGAGEADVVGAVDDGLPGGLAVAEHDLQIGVAVEQA